VAPCLPLVGSVIPRATVVLQLVSQLVAKACRWWL
jgi:hypothetical protein